MFESPAEMVSTMASVASVDIALLDADGLLEHLSKIQQLESALAARKAQTMVAFHYALSGTSADLGLEAPRPGDRLAGPAERRWSGDVLRSVTDELGLTLSAHRKTAALWLNRAAVLVDRFPATLRLLSAGGIPVAAAYHIARELALIVDDDLRAAVEAIVLAWGRRYGWRRIKKTAQRETQKVLAEYESLLHAQRQDERTTYTVNHNGGTSDLVVSTSAIDITAIMAALTLRARQLQHDGDPRNLNQLRTDLAVNRLLGNDQTTIGKPRQTTTRNGDSTTGNGEPTNSTNPTADTDINADHTGSTSDAQPTEDTDPDATPHTATAGPGADDEPEWYTPAPRTASTPDATPHTTTAEPDGDDEPKWYTPAPRTASTPDATPHTTTAGPGADDEPEWYTAAPRTASISGAMPTPGVATAAGDERVLAAGKASTDARECGDRAGAQGAEVAASPDDENVAAEDVSDTGTADRFAAARVSADTVAGVDVAVGADAMPGAAGVTGVAGLGAADPFLATDAATNQDAESVVAATISSADSGAGPVMAATTDKNADAGAGRVPGPPESGLNPAVAIQVVIHCTYAEAEALATGAICTGGELQGYGPLPQDALAMAFSRAKFRYRLTDRTP
ncbi:hypothetical protein ABZ004_40465, partial [Kribbella sp. NPDC006257]